MRVTILNILRMAAIEALRSLRKAEMARERRPGSRRKSSEMDAIGLARRSEKGLRSDGLSVSFIAQICALQPRTRW